MLLHLAVGDKESTVCWKSFFEDMKQRGLKEPLFAVLVEASASWRGVKITPSSRRQLEDLRTDSQAKPAAQLAA